MAEIPSGFCVRLYIAGELSICSIIPGFAAICSCIQLEMVLRPNTLFEQ